jgi:hypothetical protein
MRCVSVLALLLLAAPAAAQSGLPRGSDAVLLARVYRTSAAGTDPIGRMGLVLAGKSVTQALQLPASAGQPALTFSLVAERKGDGARARWELVGAGTPSTSGHLDVVSGALNRVGVLKKGDVEIFASLEAGRASGFEVGKLAQHFGAMPWGMAPSGAPGAPPMTMMPAQVAPMAPAAAMRPAKGPSMELQCPGGGAFELSIDAGRGECRSRFDEAGAVIGATCDDGAGNAAEAECRLAAGHGACVRTAGSGSCRERRR